MPAPDARVGAVVFDLDGTLVDSRRDIANATNHVLVGSGRAPLPEDEIQTYVGDGARSLVARAARLSETDAELPALLGQFLDFYTAHAADHTTALPGAVAMLSELAASFPLALCTNKPRRTTVAVLDALGLAKYFRAVVAGDDLPEKKPHPAPLEEVARQLALPAESLIMVGDGAQDVEAGRAVGARTIGIVGIQAKERLVAARPDALVESLTELPGLVRRWARLEAHSPPPER